VFLQSVRAVLELHDGSPGVGERTIAETLARVWAPWGISDSFYDDDGFKALGHHDPTAFIRAYWMDRLATFRVSDLAAMLDTWASHDIGAREPAPGFERVLTQITCPTLLISSRTDQYFRLKYAVQESRLLPDARLVELDSAWGHVAGRGFGEPEGTIIREALRAHLATGGAS
jgi:homoserine O-acetyltransferase